MAGMARRAELDKLVEKCLRQSMLWEEVKDRLKTSRTKYPAANNRAHPRPALALQPRDSLPRRIFHRESIRSPP